MPLRLASKSGKDMRYVIWLLVLVLVVLHQDFWNWTNDTLVFGFIPIGLFYHACMSIAAGVVWYFACQFAWPRDVDDFVADNVSPSEEAKG